jgi:hypothetical protein
MFMFMSVVNTIHSLPPNLRSFRVKVAWERVLYLASLRSPWLDKESKWDYLTWTSVDLQVSACLSCMHSFLSGLLCLVMLYTLLTFLYCVSIVLC